MNRVEILWLVLIGVLWGGLLLVEGLELGMGMELMFKGGDENDGDGVYEGIGGKWDGNEVWLMRGGGGMFGGFGKWYG